MFTDAACAGGAPSAQVASVSSKTKRAFTQPPSQEDRTTAGDVAGGLPQAFVQVSLR